MLRLRGKYIDPIQFWSTYCDIKSDDSGPFLSLTFCPNTEHNNNRSPAFQINVERPFVHCFAHCGISGSYEHAVCVIEGLYEKYNVTEADIARAKIRWQPNEPRKIRESRGKVRRAHSAARKIIFQRASYVGRIGKRTSPKLQHLSGKNRRTSDPVTDPKIDISENDLSTYTYLPKQAQQYLQRRGIDASSRHRFEIGFDEKAERVTIPVRNHRGKFLYVIRRGIYSWQKPAYLYPKDAPKKTLLFGLDKCDGAMVRSQGLILVEGPMDCIRLHQHGFRNTVAILGDHVSEEQIKLISRQRPRKIVLFFDKDQGGIWAVQSATPLNTKYHVKVVLYPKGEALDPAKLTSEQVEKALRNAIPFYAMMKKMKVAKDRKGEFVGT